LLALAVKGRQTEKDKEAIINNLTWLKGVG
jgi:hypothetical protein